MCSHDRYPGSRCPRCGLTPLPVDTSRYLDIRWTLVPHDSFRLWLAGAPWRGIVELASDEVQRPLSTFNIGAAHVHRAHAASNMPLVGSCDDGVGSFVGGERRKPGISGTPVQAWIEATVVYRYLGPGGALLGSGRWCRCLE